MARSVMLVGAALLVLLSLTAVAKHQEINVLFGWPVQINGSNPSFIEHGFWEHCDNALSPSPQSVKKDPPFPPMGLVLWIDGELVESGPFLIYKRPEQTTPPAVDGDAWYFRWKFHFKANYFSNGPHHFHMEWMVGDEVVHMADHMVLVVGSRK